MKNKRIRIGHVGTKHDHSEGKLECIAKYPDIFEIVGIVEQDPVQKAYTMNNPTYSRYPFLTEEQLLDSGCDAVLLEGFEYDLPFDARTFLNEGVAVHMDKPAGRDFMVFSEAIKIAETKGLPFQLAYMYRYNPAILEALDFVKKGKIGDIFSVSGIMNTGHNTEKRQWLDRFDGGIMFFLGCHMVDLAHLFMGIPEHIESYLMASGIDGTTSIDQATSILTYPAGYSIVQANACEINGYGRRQFTICGSEGTYEIRPLECPIGAKYTHESFAHCYKDKHKNRCIQTVSRESRYDDMLLDFAAMVRGEKINQFSYDYEIDTQRLVLACCGIKEFEL